mgnify:CR=1 FL=1
MAARFKVKVVVVIRATVHKVVVIRAIVHRVVVAIKAIVQITIVLDKQAAVHVEMYLKQRNKKKSIKNQFKIRSRKHKLNYLAKVVEVRA